ncbi:serine/threonine-protein kinase [Nocardia sp. NPDC046763]|uniref:serine/threonine-protein kinase n=1 Tax=Nocardia sp. NPDC046763 TaxID=3155256 RepID=UPI0034068F7E
MIDVGCDSPENAALSIAGVIDRFASAWKERGSPPDPHAFLAESGGYRRILLIELIKVDLDYRWVHYRFPKRLADYQAEYPELNTAPLPPDLVYEEIHARLKGGDAPDPEEYSANTSLQATRLTQNLAEPEYRSTLIVQPGILDALGEFESGGRIDDFDLLMRLGSGAFARVFLARQRSLQRFVAVKISRNHGKEPETLAQLDHDYIVRVFDQRILHDGALKLMYMQFLPGGTLLDVLRHIQATKPEQRSGRLLLEAIDGTLSRRGIVEPAESAVRREIAELSWPDTVAWLGVRLASAIDYAHRRGILHRDLKPANILLTAEGIPKLADFNISFSRHIAGASPLAYFGGSLDYMSPEQLQACHPDMSTTPADIDTRSDLYSLAVVLFELLTGHRPISDPPDAGLSATSLEQMIAVRKHAITGEVLAGIPSDCPAVLRHTLLRCLAPQPSDRYPSGAGLARQLELCLDPRARDLVDPPSGTWRSRLAPWVLIAPVVLFVAGDAMGMLYDFFHNSPILNKYLSSTQWDYLRNVVWMIILVVMPPATGLYLFTCRYAIRVPHGLRRGRQYDSATIVRARVDLLRLGDRVALMTLGGWALGAVVATVAVAGLSTLRPSLIAHLVFANILGGLVAVSYTFLFLTFYLVRCVYPPLLLRSDITAADVHQLRALSRRCPVYLAIALSIPLLSVFFGLTFVDSTDAVAVIGPIRWLSVGAVLGSLGSYLLFRRLEGDLSALTRVVERLWFDSSDRHDNQSAEGPGRQALTPA